MNEKLFDNIPGKFIPIIKEQPSIQAFVPDPLPPKIDFSDPALWQTLSNADRALGELSGYTRLIKNPMLFIRPFINREAVLSSIIEGTVVDIEKLFEYEILKKVDDKQIPKEEEEVREVSNYADALLIGIKKLIKLPLSNRLIRELHRILLSGVRGENRTPGDFRKHQIHIGKPGSKITEASYIPPPVPDMLLALNHLEKYLNSEDSTPPLIRIGLIHYQFESIHPFYDGNGRIGRLLIVLILLAWNLLPQPLLYLSAYFNAHREEYYQRLRNISYEGAWNDWLLFFLKGIEEQSKAASQLCSNLLELQEKWHKELGFERESVKLLSLVDNLLKYPFITVPNIVKLLTVSFPTAKKYVDKLVKAKILDVLKGSSNPIVYCAPDILKLLS
jgi:Fic family protein